MKTMFSARQWICLVCLCGILLGAITGCTPLKKKFIRQKKKEKSGTGDFIPVLEPEVYPAKTTGPLDVYAQQYSLFNVWMSDFSDNVQSADNEKRLVASLDSALAAIESMVSLLQSPYAEELTVVKNQVKVIRGEYEKPSSFRNRSKISASVRDIERKVKNQFKPKMIEEFLVSGL